jgi:hypothetical protein
MRLRPARVIFILTLISLTALAACGSDTPVGPGPGHVHNGPPVWSEITNFPASATIYGVWAPSNDNVIAVGSGGRIWQWNNIQWTELSHFSTNDLYAIDGSTTGKVVAVGERGTVLQEESGQFYTRDSGVTNNLHDVWRAPAGNFVAVGDGGTILRGSDDTWAPDSSGTNRVLLSVWGASDSDIFAVGVDGIILHYNGSVWSEMTSGTNQILASVSGNSATDVYAAGAAGTLLHYDGVNWSAMQSNTGDFLQSVCAECGPAAAGANGTVVRMSNSAFKRDSVTGAPWLYAITRAGDDMWSLGANAMFRYDGTRWNSDTRGTVPVLRGMTSNASLGLVAVGNDGITMLKGPSRWSLEDAGALQRLNAVYTAPDGEVYAAGTNRIFHYTSLGWAVENGYTVEYFGFGANKDHLFVVGGNGTVLERRGAGDWRTASVQQQTSAELHGIRMTDTGGYIAGTAGTILTYENNVWTSKNIGTASTLWDVMPLSGGASYRAVVVGANGVSFGLPRDDATTWLDIPTHVSATLYSLAFGPGGDLYAAGVNGSLLRLDDINWTLITTPTTRTFFDAWERDGALYLCGGTDPSGMLFRYGPSD